MEVIYPKACGVDVQKSFVVVANPKQVRCIKGEKDDNKDAKRIADFLRLEQYVAVLFQTKILKSSESLHAIFTN